MDYYLDVLILPSAEFQEPVLMNEVFSRLHQALVSYGKGDIGISFPNFDKKLGNILRLHGSQTSLQQLMSIQWMIRMMDYIKISKIKKIPEVVNYRVVRRIQSKSNCERLFRRSVRKGWLTEEEASLKIKETGDKKLSLPFLQLKSGSTQQRFHLFVEHGPILETFVEGTFNSYGLSSHATVPWF